ncbi:hypothetical protein BT96DRAFT_1022038 [Gymnopus androsaceus JB14]|uniref:Uncharacterized protein n=1 Tax=Gymnopus androsaceus JB14 TaxID=1447944 RepID=A0A6A4HD94_9AGAR|nr:hypothetical protein BT96DRAFT_1022038 [Gymnopus androsaceus JB14]
MPVLLGGFILTPLRVVKPELASRLCMSSLLAANNTNGSRGHILWVFCPRTILVLALVPILSLSPPALTLVPLWRS